MSLNQTKSSSGTSWTISDRFWSTRSTHKTIKSLFNSLTILITPSTFSAVTTMLNTLPYKLKLVQKLSKNSMFKSPPLFCSPKHTKPFWRCMKNQQKSEAFSMIFQYNLKSIGNSKKKIDKFGFQKLTQYCLVAQLLYLLKEQSRIQNADLQHKWSIF
jgi:hypothetical protein